MPYKKPVRIATIFSDDEFKRIREYAEKRGVSLYHLAKESIREFVRKHP